MLVDRLNVNDSEPLSSEFYTERRRLITPAEVDYYEWPSCVGHGCTVVGDDGRCPFDSYHWCHQIKGAVYHVGGLTRGGKCYMALTDCMGCMMPQYRDVRADALKPVSCAKHRWHGVKFGEYDHKLDNERQFVYKICVKSGSVVDGIKFYYKTPKNEDYSDYIYTESPWYGGKGGAEYCYDPVEHDLGPIFEEIYVKSAFSINALVFNDNPNKRFGGNGGDIEEKFCGGVLRSVGVYHGYNPILGYTAINGLKFDWLDDDSADYVVNKMCSNGEAECGMFGKC